MTLRPANPEEVEEAVKTHSRVWLRGGGSKTGLTPDPSPIAPPPSGRGAPPPIGFPPLPGVGGAMGEGGQGGEVLDLSGLSGVIEYAPEEYTFTALAGTRISEVAALLAERGQYLPFDPILVRRGATLGGTVAAGANGPGRQRYGGVRDFLLAVRFVDGAGNLIRGGAKVVKNAAGFDLPKLMVGSRGRLGALVELTFKVFPAPEAYATLALDYPHLNAALMDVMRLLTSSLELHALDLEPAETNHGWKLWVRLGGLAEALPARIERVRGFLFPPGGGATAADVIADDDAIWQEITELDWVPPDCALVKIPLTPRRIPALEARLQGVAARRRYSAGGNVAWLAWPIAGDAWAADLDRLLTDLDLSGLPFLGPPGAGRLGVDSGAPLARRVKQALDPHARFLDF